MVNQEHIQKLFEDQYIWIIFVFDLMSAKV